MRDRILPHFLEGEKAVLGACLLDNQCIPKVRTVLEPKDFYSSNHSLIFQMVCALSDKGDPVDWLTLTRILDKFGHLDRIGGTQCLTELSDAVPSAANVLHYAERVKEKSTLREVILSLSEVVEKCYAADADIKAVQTELQKAAFQTATKTTKKRLVHIKDVIPSTTDQIETAGERGIPSGLLSIDQFTKGFRAQEWIVVAGRPSMGKSSLALDFANGALKRTAVALFSLEMSNEEVCSRQLSRSADVPLFQIRSGKMGDRDWKKLTDAMAPISEMPLFLDDSGSVSPSQVRTKVQELTIRTGLEIGLVIIDYLQLMKPDGIFSSEVERISNITRDLKLVAKDLNCPVVTLSQLNRQLEQRPFRNHERRPRLSDLRGSGSIEQDADIIIGLYRPEVYNPDDPQYKGKAEACIIKQRNGALGIANLTWHPHTVRFTDPLQTDSNPDPNWQDRDDDRHLLEGEPF